MSTLRKQGLYKDKKMRKFLLPFLFLSANALAQTPNQAWLDSLIQNHWTVPAAQAVVRLNHEIWQIWLEEDSPDLETQFTQLRSLGQYPQLMPQLQRNPEIAGLLMLTGEPLVMAELLRQGTCYVEIANVFMREITPQDARIASHILQKHSPLICALSKRGFPDAYELFMLNQESVANATYLDWVADTLENGLRRSDEDLASLLNLVAEQGQQLRKQMEIDKAFRLNFQSRLWPDLDRIVRNTRYPYEVFLSDPYLWQLLALQDGAKLLRKWSEQQTYGIMPSEVLFGREAYPKRLRPMIQDALLEGKEYTLSALLMFGKHPSFENLLTRGLSPDLQHILFGKLFEADVNYPGRIEYYSTLSNDALRHEFIPRKGMITYMPGFDLYELIEKLAQGRKVSTSDVFWAGFDVADVIFTAVTLGAANTLTKTAKTSGQQGFKAVSLIPGYDAVSAVKALAQGGSVPMSQGVFAALDVVPGTTVGKGAGKIVLTLGKQQFVEVLEKGISKEGLDFVLSKSLRKFAGQLGSEMAEETVREAFERYARHILVKRMGKRIAARAVKSMLKPWLRHGLLLQTKTTLRQRGSKALASNMSIDITDLTRTLFKHGSDRASYRRLTNLEARLFMRRDARIFVTVEKNSLSTAMKRFFATTAIDAAGELATSAPARKVAQTSLEAWQKNVSAWWLMNATNLPERIAR